MIIPVILLIASFIFWRLSRSANDGVVGWFRFVVALFLLSLTVCYAALILVHGLAGW